MLDKTVNSAYTSARSAFLPLKHDIPNLEKRNSRYGVSRRENGSVPSIRTLLLTIVLRKVSWHIDREQKTDGIGSCEAGN